MAKTQYERSKASIRRYQKKMAVITISLRPEEKEYLKERAKEEGQSLAGYIKDRLFGIETARQQVFKDKEEVKNGILEQ